MFSRKFFKVHLRSLQLRLVVIFIFMAILLIIPISIWMQGAIESSYYNSLKKYIENGSNEWIINEDADIKNLSDQLDINGKQKLAITYFNIIGRYKSYTVVDTEKMAAMNDLNKIDEAILSTDPQFNKKDLQTDFINELMGSTNFTNAMAGNKGYLKKTHMTKNDKRYFDYAFPFKEGKFVIYFRYYSEEWDPTIKDLNKTLLLCCAFAISVSLIFGIILSKTITSPIVSIMHKAQGIAKGNFDQVLLVKSDDEIGKLTQSFNYMANELKFTLNEISSEKNKIETIINYMADGIIAYNIKGEVIHANPASKAILGQTNISCTFNKLSAEYDLGITLEDVTYLEFPGTKEKDITIEDKYIKVYFAVFTDEDKRAGGIIVVLHDDTEQQKLENMRREFVANVSHELRTPLTSIKSYTETIIDGAIEDRETTERFLGVINSEADRMTRLVKDLLQLSRLDNQQMQLKKMNIDFVELVKNSVENLQLAAKDKELSLESYTIGEIPEIEVDRDRIEQVVINILSNAIKYTPNGGKITVYIGKLFNEVYVKVIDTGLGIPQKDLPRIFERFYRVDKARSREMGGTGLGLAIAKEIVEAHGGTIAIFSENDKGTEVVVKLPFSRPITDKEDPKITEGD
jgi:two-component system, OmpR family, sensor histidine kinase VicK